MFVRRRRCQSVVCPAEAAFSADEAVFTSVGVAAGDDDMEVEGAGVGDAVTGVGTVPGAGEDGSAGGGAGEVGGVSLLSRCRISASASGFQ